MIGTCVEFSSNGQFLVGFQSPISGVNDWNQQIEFADIEQIRGFSLLLAELMIGTQGHNRT